MFIQNIEREGKMRHKIPGKLAHKPHDSQASAVAMVVAMLHLQRWELRCFRCGGRWHCCCNIRSV